LKAGRRQNPRAGASAARQEDASVGGPFVDLDARDNAEAVVPRLHDRRLAFGEIGRSGPCDKRIAVADNHVVHATRRPLREQLAQRRVALRIVGLRRSAADRLRLLRTTERERGCFYGAAVRTRAHLSDRDS
jgi:hypothetical protein